MRPNNIIPVFHIFLCFSTPGLRLQEEIPTLAKAGFKDIKKANYLCDREDY